MAQSDNIPAMLQSGEYVVRKEAVDKLGKDTMDMINNADRLGYMGGGLVPQGEHGHSAIDELLALNTLANQRSVDMTRDSAMMNKGGEVLPGEYIPKSDPRHPIHRMTEADMNNIGTVMSIIKDYQDSKSSKQQSLSRSLGFKGDQDYNPEYYEMIEYGEATGPKTGKEMLFSRGEDGVLRMQPTKYYGGLAPLKNLYQRIRGAKEISELPSSVKNLIDEISNTEDMKQGGMMDNYMYGGMPKKKKKKGYEDGGSVGVVNEIGKARKMFSDIDDLLATAALMDDYTFGPMQRKALRSMREADMVDPKDTMNQVMMLLKAREQNKIPSFEKSKSYFQGGTTGSGGGSGSGYQQPSASTSDYFQEIYETFGFIPSEDSIREDFEKRFAYDPTKAVGDIAGLTEEATGQLGSIVQQSQQVGGGFEGFGERQRGIEEARSDLYRMVEEGAEGITEESKLAQQEEAILDLARREEAGAEFDTMKPGPPEMPSGFLRAGSRRNMADGVYMWTGSRWMGPA